jgi:hypothetical protein
MACSLPIVEACFSKYFIDAPLEFLSLGAFHKLMYQVGFLPLDKPTRLFNHVSRIHELKLLVGIIVLNRDFT